MDNGASNREAGKGRDGGVMQTKEHDDEDKAKGARFEIYNNDSRTIEEDGDEDGRGPARTDR